MTVTTCRASSVASVRDVNWPCASVGLGNTAARSLYEKLGYANAGLPPERVAGTINLRGHDVEVDDVLVYLVRALA